MKILHQNPPIAMLFLFAFLANIESVTAQVVKVETTSLSYRYKDDNLKWSKWSDFEETSVLVSIDPDKDRIIVYSKKTQVFDVLDSEGKKTDEDGDNFYSFLCRDEEGKKCRVRLAILNSRSGRRQLYVDYDDLMYVYNLKNGN